MKKYQDDRPCVKCGFSNIISTEYCRCERILCIYHLDEEHLHRVCQRCGYEWAEATLDSEE